MTKTTKTTSKPRSASLPKTPAAPAPRPGQGLGTGKAQGYILVCAVITAVIYTFRRLVEPTTGTSSTSSSKLAQLAGAGAPPSLEQWIVSYGTAFFMLAVLALAAPELAVSLALMGTIGNLLTNGTTIAADISGLEGIPIEKTTKAATAQQVNQATGAA